MSPGRIIDFVKPQGYLFVNKTDKQDYMHGVKTLQEKL
jgi:hypothetical protein